MIKVEDKVLPVADFEFVFVCGLEQISGRKEPTTRYLSLRRYVNELVSIGSCVANGLEHQQCVVRGRNGWKNKQRVVITGLLL